MYNVKKLIPTDMITCTEPPDGFKADLFILEQKLSANLKKLELDHERFFKKYPVFTQDDALREIDELITEFKKQKLLLQLAWRNSMVLSEPN